MLAKRKIAASRHRRRASQHRVRLSDWLNNYLGQHCQVAKESFLQLLRAPFSSTVTWLLIGIAMALPGMLLVGLSTVERMNQNWDVGTPISLFIDKAVSDQASQELARQLALHDNIIEVDYLSRDQALEEFQSLFGYADVLQHLEKNPLPAVIVVHPIESMSPDEVTYWLNDLEALPEVERAILDIEWLQRLYHMIVLGQRITLTTAVLLALGVLLVIGNTIRLAVENRHDEIMIVKLLGGTNGFVRRPFLYTGLWYGLGGGVVACVIMSMSIFWLSKPIAELAGLYQSQFRLHSLGFVNILLLWLLGSTLGVLGAHLAVSKHL